MIKMATIESSFEPYIYIVYSMKFSKTSIYNNNAKSFISKDWGRLHDLIFNITCRSHGFFFYSFRFSTISFTICKFSYCISFFTHVPHLNFYHPFSESPKLQIFFFLSGSLVPCPKPSQMILFHRFLDICRS